MPLSYFTVLTTVFCALFIFIQVWDGIIQKATKDVDILRDPTTVKQLITILKTNVRAVKAVQHPFVQQVSPFVVNTQFTFYWSKQLSFSPLSINLIRKSWVLSWNHNSSFKKLRVLQMWGRYVMFMLTTPFVCCCVDSWDVTTWTC